jgi:hypothetical protein
MTFSGGGFSATGVDVQTIAEGRSFGVDLSNPAVGEITIRVTPAHGQAREFLRFLSYEYNENFLSLSDSWNFELAQRELSAQDSDSLTPGAKVEVLVENHLQSTGILDSVEINGDARGGSVVRIEGRDWLSPTVDSQADPRLTFKPGQTLEDVLKAVFGDFGITNFDFDNAANRNIITGQLRGTKTSKKGKPLKSYVLHEESPYPNEGAFAFAHRISQRFGLWIWPGADGKTVYVSKPDFDELPRYGLQHVYGEGAASNNVVRGHFKVSRQEQPSVLLASGFGAGGNFAKSRLRAGIVNPVVLADNSAVMKAYPHVKFVTLPTPSSAFPLLVEGFARPAYLYDGESHTQAQLENYILRELSLRLRKVLTARYEFMGHKINKQPVAVDTMINLNEGNPAFRWNGPLWVLGRRFSKTPRDGTRTTLELILPNSLVF